MTNVLKWIQGYIKVKASGLFVERFLNLCSKKGILLWDITKDAEGYYIKMKGKDFFGLKTIAKKTGTRVVILKRYGLPFILQKIVKRKIFVIGLVMVFVFLLWTSGYIWEIEISGNYRISNDVFHNFLLEENIVKGSKKNQIDIAELEKNIRNEFNIITWASVKMVGTKLIIEVKENEVGTDEKEMTMEEGWDIVCPFEGKIVSIIVRKGVPKVKVGDCITKDTIMVEGKIPIYQEDGTIKEYLYLEADADIVVEHSLSYYDNIPKIYIKKNYTGREFKEKYIKTNDKIYKLGFKKPYLQSYCLVEEKQLGLNNKIKFPFIFGNRKYSEYQNIEFERNSEDAERVLVERMEIYEKRLVEKGVQIIEKDVKIESGGELFIYKGTILVQEKIRDKSTTIK